ncbi:MAG: hypothetical protein AMJ68_02280 [Acidithiobacillales bacterium SG8_45]|nr:MAG: hypothetical protein AMJ68_02280 [Acidithiobacillales bacterium SG8_45]
MYDAAKYDSWYQTSRGKWISNNEFRLMMRQLDPEPGSTLLDVGCGTGHFSRRFAAAGLKVTGIDPDADALTFARYQSGSVEYLEGRAENLPFPDNSFDYCSAVTSLCFVPNHGKAIAEIWRVSRKAMVLGLLNRHSLLYLQKHDHGDYQGARWDTAKDIFKFANNLLPRPGSIAAETTIMIPGGGAVARLVEMLRSTRFPGGGFLSISIKK